MTGNTEPMPALTGAEADLVNAYLATVDYLGRANPTTNSQTYRAMVAAQGLAAQAAALRDALALMWQRGETEIDTAVFARALRLLDGQRRVDRIRFDG